MPVLQYKGKTAIECYHHTVPHHERVGQKVPWQKLAEDFQDETFRFQVLDEGEYVSVKPSLKKGKHLADNGN